MVLKLFSVFDKKTVVYGRPFYAHNAGHAVRCIQDEFDRSDSQLAKYPSDFTLYELGSFDDANGLVTAHEPVCVMEVIELVKK